MIRKRLSWISVSFVALIVLFVAWPELDLIISDVFFDETSRSFPANRESWVRFVYVAFKDMPLFLVPALIIATALSWLRFAPVKLRARRHKLLFLMLFLLIGPGLLVHAGFKNNWDRARPRDIVVFGGEQHFTPAWVISDQCEKNCSFTSGHAAMGFAFIALAWVWEWQLGLLLGVVLGLFVGEVRVMQGGHFLSDVIFSGYICYFTAWLLARIILPVDQNRQLSTQSH
ncbi:phosphatase PAP2 family protein [Oceanospirillum sp.]|uniref:phosphatase PAP2 family protein n=1 Tax=Oceanospirillum sp. TaxID=2021254 RepID=UPI003A8FA691